MFPEHIQLGRYLVTPSKHLRLEKSFIELPLRVDVGYAPNLSMLPETQFNGVSTHPARPLERQVFL